MTTSEQQEWLAGRPRPPRRHLKSSAAKERALRRVYPRQKGPRPANPLWASILQEHNADIDYWLYDDEPQPQDTEEWRLLENTVLPRVLVALERTCRLAYLLHEKEGENRLFSFSDSFVYFLLRDELTETGYSPESDSSQAQEAGGSRSTEGERQMEGAVREMKKATEMMQRARAEDIPKYKIMSRNKAAKVIQKHVRGWLVRKRADVQDMRHFWKVMRGREARGDRERRLPPEDPLLDPAALRRLLGSSLWREAGAEAGRAGAARESCLPPAEELGAGLSLEQLRELVRIYSLQPDLREEAMAAFTANLS